MTDDLRRRICGFLAEHHVMTLATIGHEGPWAAAVFYAPEDLRLYFLSSPSSRHARNLAGDSRVAASVQRDYDDWPGIRGLQMEGEVSSVETTEQARVRAIYQQRFPLIGGGAGVPRKLLEALDRIRWYAFQPREIYLIDNRRGFAHREHYAVD